MHRRPVRATTPADVMDATLGAVTIGFVPVLGEIHDGHRALIRRSYQENDETIVAIADPDGGLVDIPETGLKAAREEGARIVYLPPPEMIRPDGFATSIHVAGLSDRWEGEAEPGQFERFLTLMTILLNQLQPTRTYVAEKYLQLVTATRRMHRDLSLPGEIVISPTVRDPDGLPTGTATSALSPEEREAARAIPSALFTMQELAREGERSTEALVTAGRKIIENQPLVSTEYLAIVDPETFEPVDTIEDGSRAIFAGTIGGTRLTDNMHLVAGTLDE